MPWLAVAKNLVEPNPYLPWPAHADCVGTFHANDFNLPTTIALIVVVQNLSCFQHNRPPRLQTADHDELTWSD
jgi:hypothetical protein